MTSALYKQTGGIWPIGVSCSLTWLDLGAIAHILQIAHIRLVVEIGVEHGGLAAYLASYCHYTGCVYRGVDITLNALDYTVRDDMGGTELFQRDAWAAATIEEVRGWVNATDGPALIFCDGGNKPKELHLYAPLIRPGDILLGHDHGNEYTDAAIADMPLTRLHADWLDDTLLCAFARGGL